MADTCLTNSIPANDEANARRWAAVPEHDANHDHLEAIWCVVVPPENCPRPKDLK